MRPSRNWLLAVLIAVAVSAGTSTAFGQSPRTGTEASRVDRTTVTAACFNGQPTGFINRLYRAAVRHGNYGDLSLRPCRHEVLLYGQGRPARDVARMMSAAHNYDVTVLWRQSRYSRAELRVEARWLRKHPKVWAVDITMPARGLTVYSYSKQLQSSAHPRRDLGAAYPVVVRRPPTAVDLAGPVYLN